MSEKPVTWDQMKRFHAMVRDISNQVPFNGEMLDEKEWKLIIYAGAFGQEVVKNPLGFGDPLIVRNKHRTKSIDKSGEGPNMNDLITQLLVFGNEKGVQWTDPEWQSYLRECEARN